MCQSPNICDASGRCKASTFRALCSGWVQARPPKFTGGSGAAFWGVTTAAVRVNHARTRVTILCTMTTRPTPVLQLPTCAATEEGAGVCTGSSQACVCGSPNVCDASTQLCKVGQGSIPQLFCQARDAVGAALCNAESPCMLIIPACVPVKPHASIHVSIKRGAMLAGPAQNTCEHTSFMYRPLEVP